MAARLFRGLLRLAEQLFLLGGRTTLLAEKFVTLWLAVGLSFLTLHRDPWVFLGEQLCGTDFPARPKPAGKPVPRWLAANGLATKAKSTLIAPLRWRELARLCRFLRIVDTPPSLSRWRRVWQLRVLRIVDTPPSLSRWRRVWQLREPSLASTAPLALCRWTEGLPTIAYGCSLQTREPPAQGRWGKMVDFNARL